MKRVKSITAIVLAALSIVSCTQQKQASTLTKEEIVKTASDAYIYSLPLVFTDFTRLASGSQPNTYNHIRTFPDHTSRLVVRPNNDTNYSSAFLDLEDDAQVLTLPDSKDRYYVTPLYDGWTNVFASFGKRTTGTKEQHYVVTGPHWKGTIPKGLTEVKSPTDEVWIIGRIQVNNPDDQANFVSKLQDGFKITSLSEWVSGKIADKKESKKYDIVAPAVASVQKKEATVVKAIKNLSLEDYFNYVNELLVKNPSLVADSSEIKGFEAIGIGAGLKFSLVSFDAQTQELLKNISTEIYAEFDKNQSFLRGQGNDKPDLTIGKYGTNYKKRAFVAYVGLGALNAEEAVYPSYSTDADGKPLDGNNKYVIHYPKGQTPPAQAFWSLTLYDKDGYLAANDIKRYAIGDRDNLKYNKDGSLDIYIQHENPGKDKENNWLPAPLESFSLANRIYLPTSDYLYKEGTWKKPPVTKIK